MANRTEPNLDSAPETLELDVDVDVDALRPSLRFPSAELMQAAASMWSRRKLESAPVVGAPTDREWYEREAGSGFEWRERQAVEAPGLRPGQYPELVAGPGMVQIRYRSAGSWDRARERDHRASDLAYRERAARLASALVTPMAFAETVEEIFAADEPSSPKRSKIRRWSSKSRARLIYTILSLDLAAFVRDSVPVMLTLTLPGDWRAVAPDAAAAHGLYRRFQKRYERRWGAAAWIWKKEFQRRGAPHWHLWLVCPTEDRAAFASWLADAWASVVSASADPDRNLEHRLGVCACSERCRHLARGTNLSFADGMKAADPKRLAVYFLKESLGGEAKAYQNDAPSDWDSTGRFWGRRRYPDCSRSTTLRHSLGYPRLALASTHSPCPWRCCPRSRRSRQLPHRCRPLSLRSTSHHSRSSCRLDRSPQRGRASRGSVSTARTSRLSSPFPSTATIRGANGRQRAGGASCHMCHKCPRHAA